MSNLQGYEQFFKNMDEILKKIKSTQGSVIREAADLIATSVANEGIVHIYGAGHSHELAEDIFFRAGTLVPVNALLDPGTSGSIDVTKSAYTERLEGYGKIIYDHTRPKPEDIFIIISNSGRNPVGIDLARTAQENGHKIIALTSLNYSQNISSRHSSGKKLLDYADVILDNCGELGDICIKVDWMEQGLGPTSTIAGAYILTAIMVETVFELKNRGVEPPVFMSGNFDKGMNFNEKYLKKYWSRIRNW
jgi:uncharacterized phosphosugar-binding protein